MIIGQLLLDQKNRGTLIAFSTNNNLIHIGHHSSTVILSTFRISIWGVSDLTELPLCIRTKIIADRASFQIIGAAFRSIASIGSWYPNYPIQILSKIFNNSSYNRHLCGTILDQSIYGMVDLFLIQNRVTSLEIFLLFHPYFITHLALTIILNKTSITIIIHCCSITQWHIVYHLFIGW